MASSDEDDTVPVFGMDIVRDMHEPPQFVETDTVFVWVPNVALDPVRDYTAPKMWSGTDTVTDHVALVKDFCSTGVLRMTYRNEDVLFKVSREFARRVAAADFDKRVAYLDMACIVTLANHHRVTEGEHYIGRLGKERTVIEDSHEAEGRAAVRPPRIELPELELRVAWTETAAGKLERPFLYSVLPLTDVDVDAYEAIRSEEHATLGLFNCPRQAVREPFGAKPGISHVEQWTTNWQMAQSLPYTVRLQVSLGFTRDEHDKGTLVMHNGLFATARDTDGRNTLALNQWRTATQCVRDAGRIAGQHYHGHEVPGQAGKHDQKQIPAAGRAFRLEGDERSIRVDLLDPRFRDLHSIRLHDRIRRAYEQQVEAAKVQFPDEFQQGVALRECNDMMQKAINNWTDTAEVDAFLIHTIAFVGSEDDEADDLADADASVVAIALDDSSTTTHERLRGDVNALEASHAGLTDEIKATKDEHKKLSDEVKATKDENKKLSDEVKALKASSNLFQEEMKEKVNKMEARLAEIEAENLRLKEKSAIRKRKLQGSDGEGHDGRGGKRRHTMNEYKVPEGFEFGKLR